MARKPQFTRTRITSVIHLSRVEMKDGEPKVVENKVIVIEDKEVKEDDIRYINSIIRKYGLRGQWFVDKIEIEKQTYSMPLERFYEIANVVTGGEE